MDWGYVLTLLAVLVISLTCHEAAHGFVAMLGGDRTAWNQGLVTINPIPHIRRQPFAMLLLPMLVLYFSGGNFCCGGATGHSRCPQCGTLCSRQRHAGSTERRAQAAAALLFSAYTSATGAPSPGLMGGNAAPISVND